MVSLFQDYAQQFDVQPVSELEAYCKQEGVSLFLVRGPSKVKDANKVPIRAGTILMQILVLLKQYIKPLWRTVLSINFADRTKST